MKELKTLREVAPYLSDDYEYVLTCPLCGGDYLHHEIVEIFEREEDREKGLHVVVENGQIKIDDVLTGNPSHRRNGLKIRFFCEQCPAKPTMIISQHKGQTAIGWE